MSNTVNRESPTDTPSTSSPSEADVLQRLISNLASISKDGQQRLINTVCTFLDLSAPTERKPTSATSSRRDIEVSSSSFQFSEEEIPSPKQFMHDKSPQTDVERVACLAYYLAHFRSTPHVKTKDISAINTESAHRKFSNAANAVENATKQGYLVPSIKGCKQVSAAGEQFVEALPDRETAKEIMDRARIGRVSKNAKRKTSSTNNQ